LSKSGQNTFAKYQYFELGDFLPTVQQILSELGLCGVVSFDASIASLTIYDVDGDGSILFTSPMGSAALKGCHEVQNIGAVETYQRRYLWVTAMEIVEHDALDAGTVVETVAKVTQINSSHDALVKKLNAAARQGTESLAKAWKSLTPSQQHEMAGIKEDMKAAAAMKDESIATQA